MSTVVNSAAYADGHKVGDVAIDDISTILETENQFVWIGVHEPTEDLLRKLQKEFGLHDLAVEDALCAHQRPKLEEYGNGFFAVLRTASLQDGEIGFGETHIFIGPHYVVAVRHGASLPYTEVRARCESAPQLLRRGPGFVLYALMDFVVDHYFPIVDALEDQLESLEEDLFQEQFNRQLTQQIYDLKRDLVLIKRAISPLVEMCNRLVRFDTSLIQEDMRPYFRDVYDHVIRINETVDNLRELLTAALEANLSLISVAQNDVMKKLAAWAAIIAIPTLVAGIYGMNFENMPELHWRYGYFGLMGALAALCAFVHSRFKRAGWV